ncbi:hypothetical protein BS78_05G182100 [Paspalum vaginatum]|nr:hypothetical protein BS78_05G182100 [Paspalum vaginatum]
MVSGTSLQASPESSARCAGRRCRPKRRPLMPLPLSSNAATAGPAPHPHAARPPTPQPRTVPAACRHRHASKPPAQPSPSPVAAAAPGADHGRGRLDQRVQKQDSLVASASPSRMPICSRDGGAPKLIRPSNFS